MLSHLFSTVGCKTRLNRRHPEDQSRTCMSCVNSRPFAEATGPEAMRRRAAGGPPGRLARAAASGCACRTRGSVPWISRSCRRCHLECKRVGCRIFFTYYCSFLAQAGETPATAGESARTGARARGEARSDGGGRAVRLGHPLSSEGLWPSGHGLAGRLPRTAVHSPVLPFLFQRRAPVSPDSAQPALHDRASHYLSVLILYG